MKSEGILFAKYCNADICNCPLSTLRHEIGHGVDALFVTKVPVHIYFGRKSEHNYENFKISRLHFHLQWSFAVGYTYWEGWVKEVLKSDINCWRPDHVIVARSLF